MVSYSEIDILLSFTGFLIANALFKDASSNNQLSQEEEAELIKRVQSGESHAFDLLVVTYQQRIYFTVIRIVSDPDDANDIVQEAFIKAYKNLSSFKEGYRFYTWLYRIAVNTALNHIQQKKIRGESLDNLKEKINFDPKEDRDLEDEFLNLELKGQVKQVLELVPPDMRTVFILRAYEDLSYKEIAETLDISIGTVMSRLSRARNILKANLQKIGLI